MNSEDQISKRARLEAARARARKAMEADAKQVETLQQRRAAVTLTPVVAVAEEAVSSRERLEAARKRARVAMEADLAKALAAAKRMGRAAPEVRDEVSTCSSSERWYSTDIHHDSMGMMTPIVPSPGVKPQARGLLLSVLLSLIIVSILCTGLHHYAQRVEFHEGGRLKGIFESWKTFTFAPSHDASLTHRILEGVSDIGVLLKSILSWCGSAVAELGLACISGYPRLTAVIGLSILPAMAMTLRGS